MRQPASISALVVSIALLVAGTPASAASGVPAQEYARVNAALLDHHILPRYEKLVAAATAFAGAVRGFCAGSGTAGLADVRERYHGVMDAWMGVQHLNFGPVELFMRSHRLYFWPGARGKVAGALKALMEDDSEGALSPGNLAEASVAVQGLPAVEYLLYTDETLEGGDAAGSPQCTVLAAVSVNIQVMAEAIVADWRGGDIDFKRLFLNPAPENAYYDTHRSATLDLFKSFHGGLQIIADIKLKPVVGDTADTARPRLVESRKTGRALRNITINLEALESLYLGEGGPGLSELVSKHGKDDKLDPLMRKAFRMTLETTGSIDAPLADAIADAQQRSQAAKLLTQVLALKQIVKSRVASSLGVAVGFNAMDGD